MIRLLGIPVFLYLLIATDAVWWAFGLLVTIGATDWLDGKLARLMDQTSKLGAILDPLIDRLYLLSALVGFVIIGIIPWWVAVILIARDGILTLTMFVYRRRGLPPPDVIYLGKAATFALMSAFPWILAGHADWPGDTAAGAFGYAFLVWGTAVYVWTGGLYVWKAMAVARTFPVVDRANTGHSAVSP
ncbi:CDP-alcohol phosphatidyltransferase family protein [Antrihabitans cavernicola]|uniref:CDP-alcohol phosphatidyltransferase family protein n=2 Tax=Antrihabitans cavernicola TaxID=2495913 RepID=A0A5A7S8A2_9NOCA|nr:CDP-alcohol phosphatidyltransferase family protein [Spelaeibacter cavernicola]